MDELFITDELKNFIDSIDMSIAELEKLASVFLVLGYTKVYIGADLDILDTLDIPLGNETPDEVTVLGQKLVLSGYILLWIVAIKRVKEKSFRNDNTNGNFNIDSYISIANAYFLSVYANTIRVIYFDKIARENKSGEFIE